MIVAPIEWLPECSVAKLESAILNTIDRGALSIMILAGAHAPLVPADMNPLLQSIPVPVFGGVFPAVIFREVISHSGAIVVGLNEAPHIFEVGTPLADGIDRQLLWYEKDDPETIMLWADGCQGQFSRLVELIYDIFGGRPSYFGGVAGGLVQDEQHHSLFSNWGMLRDATLLVGFSHRFAVGLGHGLLPAAGPIVVSEAASNRVSSLDYRPALDVYREYVEALSGIRVPAGGLLEALEKFPLGIERMDGSIVVRDPIGVDAESLTCAGDVPTQATVRILRAEPEAMLRAARSAVHDALARAAQPTAGKPISEFSAALVVSCRGRGLLLKDRFPEEINGLRTELNKAGYAGVPMLGVLCLGEIANPGGRCLELLNKTAAIALVPQLPNESY